MVFKLVRTDTVEPCKIQLPVGKHLIGRGKLLDCEDKRVSRNHGELEVIDDKVVIKSLHQNPCFIIKKGMADTQILKQNCSADISNGDKFGLLPDSYWYKLLHCVGIDNEPDFQPAIEPSAEVKQETNVDLKGDDTDPLDSGNDDGSTSSEYLNVNLNETIENNIPDSPSLLGAENEQTADAESEKATQNCPSVGDTACTENNEKDEHAQDDESTTPSKRRHSLEADSSDTAKKIKIEPEIKQEAADAQAGPSNDQVDSNSDSKPDLKPAQPPINNVLRERCMYGANCYRRNPQHKAQFSHPTDADWGAGAQAVCRFGAACRRAHPRHWRDQLHPPGAAPPPPPQQFAPQQHAGQKKRKPKTKKPDNSDDDDDGTLSPGLIVHGKRVRKTVTRINSWSGSESDKEEDPFGTDESDEWQPSSNMTDSQLYTQDM